MTKVLALHGRLFLFTLLTAVTAVAALVVANETHPIDGVKTPGEDTSGAEAELSRLGPLVADSLALDPDHCAADQLESGGNLASDESQICPTSPQNLELPLECPDIKIVTKPAPSEGSGQLHTTPLPSELDTEDRPAATGKFACLLQPMPGYLPAMA